MRGRPRLSMVAAALMLLAAAPVLPADKPIVMGKRIATAMILSLTCTADMAPRRMALISFLRARGFTAVDVHEHPLDAFDNSEVAAFDAGHRIVNFYWVNSEASGEYDVSLVAPNKDKRKTRQLADAIEEMVRTSFNCGMQRLPASDFELPGGEYAAWARDQEAAIRSVGGKVR